MCRRNAEETERGVGLLPEDVVTRRISMKQRENVPQADSSHLLKHNSGKLETDRA